MNCPNCGAETNGSVCPVCGAEVGTSGGFTLAGNDQPQQPENAAYGAQPQQGMGMDPQYGGSQYQGDQCRMVMQEMHMVHRDLILAQVISSHQKKKKSGAGAVIGIIVALAVIAAAVIFLFSGSLGSQEEQEISRSVYDRN